jgi:proteic killer suppression protein
MPREGGSGEGKLPTVLISKAPRQLDQINAAFQLLDLRVPPGNRLEPLKGDLMGFYSVRINDQWRIIFEWKNDGVYNVKILDCHR